MKNSFNDVTLKTHILYTKYYNIFTKKIMFIVSIFFFAFFATRFVIYAQQIRQKAGCAIPQSFLKKNGNTKQNKKKP